MQEILGNSYDARPGEPERVRDSKQSHQTVNLVTQLLRFEKRQGRFFTTSPSDRDTTRDIHPANHYIRLRVLRSTFA